ncbi:hypothetical protein ACV3VZ_01710 [Clostridium perfringens]|nr:hypothetical protein [Clostridium perfringens]
MKINNLIKVMLGIHKSIYVNFKMFKFKDAIKFPILLSNNVKIKSLKGKININNELKIGMIRIGFGDIGTFDIRKRRSILQIDGIWEVGKNISLGHGTKISIGKNGVLKMGNNIIITAETAIICHKNIEIGNGCLISWDNLIMDTDFHKIYSLEDVKKRTNNDLPINIGNDVWIGCRCTILKGSNIRNMSVISSNSRISRNICKENVVVGNDGVILKEKIFWEF